MVSEIMNLFQDQEAEAKRFYERVKNGEITHGMGCYRLKNGDIKYFLINPRHMTYIIGLMERVQNHMMNEK
jgi:hypothetical protein